MIRACTIDEVAKFADLGAWFFGTLQLPGQFNKEVFCQNWLKLIGNEMGFILGRFNGESTPQEAIGTIIYPDVFTGELTAVTTFWFYIEEPKGLEAGLLHEAWECVCKARGVKVLSRGVLCNERIAKVGGFLLKAGYQLTEMQYRKEI